MPAKEENSENICPLPADTPYHARVEGQSRMTLLRISVVGRSTLVMPGRKACCRGKHSRKFQPHVRPFAAQNRSGRRNSATRLRLPLGGRQQLRARGGDSRNFQIPVCCAGSPRFEPVARRHDSLLPKRIIGVGSISSRISADSCVLGQGFSDLMICTCQRASYSSCVRRDAGTTARPCGGCCSATGVRQPAWSRTRPPLLSP
jgi:hypothetical protein